MNDPHTPPLVSVLTAVHNAERFLATTIESILGQTFGSFEYILINDQSTDSSPAILEQYARQDSRIVLLNTDRHLNPSDTLNVGLRAAQGKYIANLDHDDIAMPERLAKQVAFLEQNPTIGAVGSYPIWIDENGQTMPVTETLAREEYFPTSPAGTRWVLHFQPALPHCSLTVRREAMNLVQGYSSRYRFICDYDLQIRLAEHIDMVNLPECLAAYRVYKGQTSDVHRTEQNGMYFLRIASVMRQRLRESVAIDEVVAYYHSIGGIAVKDNSLINRVAVLLERLYQRFLESETLSLNDLAWVQQSYANYLASFATANKGISPELTAPLIKKSEELAKHALGRYA